MTEVTADAPLALDLHPVGARIHAVLLGFHLTGQLNRAAKQQQLLRQCGLAGVRVRDDRERPAAGDRVFERLSHFKGIRSKRGFYQRLVRLSSEGGESAGDGSTGVRRFRRQPAPVAVRPFPGTIEHAGPVAWGQEPGLRRRAA